MNKVQPVNTVMLQQKMYKYIIDGKNLTITLSVDDSDIIMNADDTPDCPLEAVLRKSSFTMNDLTKWDIVSVRFIEIVDGNESIINQINCENVHNSIRV